MGRFKHLHKGVKIYRTIEAIAALVPTNYETLQGYTLRHRYIVCEQDNIPIGNITGYRIYTLQGNGFQS